jgi:hypothetical protein
VPAAPEEADGLARRPGFESGARFLGEPERHTAQARELFLSLLARERSPRVASASL